MMSDLIREIEKLCNESEENATNILMNIKKMIQNSRKPDFSKIADGEHFTYRGMEWIRLGAEQGGILCMVAKVIGEMPFDEDDCNNWRDSSLRKRLNTEFLDLLNPDDLMDFTSDLTADSGEKYYGTCADKVGILSCDLYRKYREYIPLFEEWMVTCTPWACRTPNRSYANVVRYVSLSGALYGRKALNPTGVAPACIFRQ